MAITNASTLAEYASGISTQGATLTVDANNKRVGIGTTNPLAMLQVGTGVTVFGNAGIASFTSLKLSGETDSTSTTTGALTVTGGVGIGLSLTVGGDVSVGGTITYEDVTNVDSLGIVTARSGLRVVGGGVTCVGVATFFDNVNITDGKKVGIGTTNPTELVDIVSDSSCGISIKDGNNGFAASKIKVENGGRDLSIGAPQDIIFKDIDTQAAHLYIESTGHIGIGTDNPAHLLHLEGESPVIQLEDSDNTANIYSLINGGGSAGRLLFQVDPADEGTNSYVRFDIDGAEKVRINSVGRLGIGTAQPTALLSLPAQASGDSGVARIAIESQTDDNDFTISQYEDGSGTYTLVGQNIELNGSGNTTVLDSAHKTASMMFDGRNNGALMFNTGGTGGASVERLRIQSTGQILYSASGGDNTITSKRTNAASSNGNYFFHVNANNSDDATVGSLGFHRDLAADDSRIVFSTRATGNSNTERLRINSIGNVGIATDITGSGGAYGRLGVVIPSQAGGAALQVMNSAQGSGDGSLSNIVLRSVNNLGSQWAGAEYRAHYHVFSYQGTEKVRITSAGKIGINKTSPAGYLHIHQGDSGTTDAIVITNTSTTNNGLMIGVNSTEDAFFWNGSNTNMTFATNNAERMRIGPSGNVGLRTDAGLWSTSSDQTVIQLKYSTLWDYAGVQFDVGYNYYYDGSAYKYNRGGYASRISQHNNTGDIVFWSGGTGSANGTITWVERMRLTDDGKLGIGTDSFNQEFTVNGDSFTGLVIKSTRTTSTQQIGGLQFMNHAVGVSTAAVVGLVNGTLKLKSAGSDVFTIDSKSSTVVNGYIQVFQSESDAQYDGINYSFHKIQTNNNNWTLGIENSHDSAPYGLLIKYSDASPDNTENTPIMFADSSTTRFKVTGAGDVWTSDDGTLTSDQTLKENITDATSKLEDIKKLKVRNFNWKSSYHPEKSKKKQIGFIAQEVEQVFPSLVTESDISPDSGNQDHTPIMKKGIKAAWDPIIIKAMQELITKVETLETKVAALESA